MKKIQDSTDSSGEANAQNSKSAPSVDTTRVLSLMEAAFKLLGIKIKATFDQPKKLMIIFLFLSVCIPLSTFIIRLVGSFTFWCLWLLTYYGTIWTFGHFNKSNCEIKKVLTPYFYVKRKMFFAWFMVESFLFLTIGWYLVPIRGPITLLIVYFSLFAAGGLIYGLGDVTCPHCGAINAGQRIKDTAKYTDYHCCICKKEFSHYMDPQ